MKFISFIGSTLKELKTTKIFISNSNIRKKFSLNPDNLKTMTKICCSLTSRFSNWVKTISCIFYAKLQQVAVLRAELFWQNKKLAFVKNHNTRQIATTIVTE